MARPLRIEYPGAVYHVTSRGNERKAIFRSNADREAFLAFLGQTVKRFGWSVTAWVLMTNHFHLVIQTPEPNLSRGMHWLNGSYAGRFNRGHKRWGHLFGRRFKAFIIEKDAYFAEVLRYVVLNLTLCIQLTLRSLGRKICSTCVSGVNSTPERSNPLSKAWTCPPTNTVARSTGVKISVPSHDSAAKKHPTKTCNSGPISRLLTTNSDNSRRSGPHLPNTEST
jgi:REP element-mobilizing transposase RayT